MAARIGGTAKTNQTGELAAVILALTRLDNFRPIHFKTDSEYVKKGLTERFQTWEDNGWIKMSNKDLFKKALDLLRRRSAPTWFEWVKGHSGDPGNEGADELADQGAHDDAPTDLDLSIKPEWNLTGAKLSTLTQAIAYHGIRERASQDKRTGPQTQLNLARDALEAFTGHLETDPSLWKGITHQDIRRPIRTFLFRAYHNSYKLGDFWAKIQDYEKARCEACNDPAESLAHILFECEAEPQNIIWKLAKELWPHGDETWPHLSMGIILACGNLEVRKPRNGREVEEEQENKRDPGATRLLKIIISESAHLIWRLRCERRIGGRTHTATSITRRWHQAINDRLVTDQIAARNIIRTESNYRNVEDTWKGTLKDERFLPFEWAKAKEVLVGIVPPRPPI
ncbi:RnaseH-domain-containing protein [Auriscalpium vulgare]|uniref:RnaseH-domain-containing protein n=1 Tax=Auriscalpium vulgare TaxID=40419 RepID=A0ACB8S536_9AGAM|nr:RnaseH-domain-containing protein [Auriscalpium vulgare]